MRDALVDAAYAGAVDDGARAVEEDAQRDAAGFGLGVGGERGGVEGRGEVVSPGEETLIEAFDQLLDFRPFPGSDAWAVELCDDFFDEDAEFCVVFEVD